jgi:hypothetical protein
MGLGVLLHQPARGLNEVALDHGPLDIALVGNPGCSRPARPLQPALQQLSQGRVGGRSSALVDPGEQSGTKGLGFALGPGGAGAVAALAGERVAAGWTMTCQASPRWQMKPPAIPATLGR